MSGSAREASRKREFGIAAIVALSGRKRRLHQYPTAGSLPGSTMAQSPEVTNMALFCDFENIALGVQDAKYDKFDIGKVLERLLLKGSIVVKKAYCDWERYKSFKAPMHEASF